MPVIEVGDRKYEVTDDGFLLSPDKWDETAASDLASTDGLPCLTDDHWKVVRYVRAYWIDNRSAPLARKLCKETGFTLQQLYDLFPSGPIKGSCKIAGLPKPAECA